MDQRANDSRMLVGWGVEDKAIPVHSGSPTVVTGWVRRDVLRLCKVVLDAYLEGSRRASRPFSYLVGLDIAITGEIGRVDGRLAVVDIEPVLIEGPFCNGLPSCPSFMPVRLEPSLDVRGNLLDPAHVIERLIRLFRQIWSGAGRSGDPVIGVLTMAPKDCFENLAHQQIVEECRRSGLEAVRLSPGSDLEVHGGRVHCAGHAVDLIYRRIERSRILEDFAEPVGRQIVEETEKTLWTNHPDSDDLRSKVFEEEAFRDWEARTGRRIPRPRTLVGGEISAAAIRGFLARGGFVVKEADTSGGAGVRLVLDEPLNRPVFEQLYGRFDGPHMDVCEGAALAAKVTRAARPEVEGVVQQLRALDARNLEPGRALVYDLRVTCLFDPAEATWELVSGFSRVVPCGEDAEGSTLLTNVSAGAHLAPLRILPPSTDVSGSSAGTAHELETTRHGPLMETLLAGRRQWVPSLP